MLGAIIGDMIGAPFEFDRGGKTKSFPLFGKGTEFTDDTVMTVAVAEALMMSSFSGNIKENVIWYMQKWGKEYPDAGYGARFNVWLHSEDPQPYNSYGNGSAMRVSAAGWLGKDVDSVLRLAKLTAEVTHNHPDGIRGAQATAVCIYMARKGFDKKTMKNYVMEEFGYDLTRTCDEIRPGYHHVESCQQTVPEAITAFLEGEDFEDVIRTAVSLGGDCDTLTCIAGSIAEAFYGIPPVIALQALHKLPDRMRQVIQDFYTIVLMNA